ncbi:MAG: hypothetical protein U1D30_02710 [Planctomycetota bacterium]
MLLLPLAAFGQEMTFESVEASLGPYGPVMESSAILPFEERFYRYRLKGVKSDEKGYVKIAVNTRVLNPTGKLISDTKDTLEGVLSVGGTIVPGTSAVTFGENHPIGAYTLIVVAKDQANGNEAEFRKRFTLKKPEFAVVSTRFSRDRDGKIPSAAGGLVGQSLFFNVRIVGFDRSTGKIDVDMVVNVLDDELNPILQNVVRANTTTADPKIVNETPFLSFGGHLFLNREGTFTFMVVANDRIKKKEARFVASIKVSNPQ